MYTEKSKLHEMGLLPNRGVCLDSFRGLSSSSPPRGTLLDRALRPRVKCLGLFVRCPFVEKSCERLSDLKPRTGQHPGESNLAPIKTSGEVAALEQP